ncbi:DUF4328 domain-containing protein [Streptacidiphilus sp. EB103A]|uniref:DUF4328 domain-containing protein n=1 Tax=Streptacidiphilus sp. EB103A TaxID=3156275 RepID=UPI003515D3F4
MTDAVQPGSLPAAADGTTPVDALAQARNAQIALALAALVEPARAASGIWDRTVVVNGVTRASTFYSLASVLNTIAVLGAVVAFLLWLRRCRTNADILAPGTATYSTGWVVGAWFTPLLMWWRPRRIVLDIHRASHAEAPDHTGIRLINFWWAARVGYSVTVTIIVALTGSIVRVSPVITIVLEVVYIASAVLLIVVINRVTEAQARRFAPSSVWA